MLPGTRFLIAGYISPRGRRVISTVIFDFGGVISSPLFVGIGDVRGSRGLPEGFAARSCCSARRTTSASRDARGRRRDRRRSRRGAKPRARSKTSPTGTCSRRAQIDVATYFDRMVEKAPAVLGQPIDMDAYGRFWRQTAPGVHWMVVHKIRELKDRGLRLGLLTNNVKEFGEHWRTMFPIDELCEEVVDSSHVGMRKPEREIYELTCARMGIEPERSRVRRRQRRQRRRRPRATAWKPCTSARPVGGARRARRDPRTPRHALRATRR